MPQGMPGSPVVDLRNSFGAAFIGLVLCVVLFGLALAQTWMYFWHHWNKDTKALKTFIACITTLDVIHTAMIVYSMYWYLVLNFGSVEALAVNKWFFIIQGNVGALYTSAVQLYYVRRIYLVSRNIIPPILIVSMSIVGNALTFYLMAIQLAGGKIAGRFGDVEWMGIFSAASCMVMDLLITGLMSQALYRKKSGFARSDSIIKTLVAYTINTGLLTTLVAAATTIALSIAPTSLIPTAIYFPMGKLYINSVLAMLNSRDYVRDRGSPDNLDNSFSLSSIRVELQTEAFGSKSKPTDISVIVCRSTALVDAQNEFDPNMGNTCEVPKLDTSITFNSQNRISASST